MVAVSIFGEQNRMNDIVLQPAFARALKAWWIWALAIFLGGIAGWVFALFHAPVYEATAFYRVTVDAAEINRRLGFDPQRTLEFSDSNVYLSPAADVFYLLEIPEELAAAAKRQGLSFAAGQFIPGNFILDRRGSTWFVTVRQTDPNRAAQLANLWLELVDNHLRDMSAHAFRVEALEVQRSSLIACFSSMDFTQANQCAGTVFSSPNDFDQYISGLDHSIALEREASHGLDTVLAFYLDRPAEVPANPILYSRSSAILAGGLLGFVVGLVLTQIHLDRSRRRERA
jgi:hypothetical protein